MIARPLILATLTMILAGCSAGAVPSASPLPTPTPTPTPSPTPWPTITLAAYNITAETCRQAVPMMVYPNDPKYNDQPVMVSGYDTVSLVPVDITSLDHDVVPVPVSIKDLWLNGLPDDRSEPGFGAIARPIGGGADVLVCVNFYVTDEGYYESAGEYAVADQGMWAVDAATDKMLGDPWVSQSNGLPKELLIDNKSEPPGTDIGQAIRLLGAGRQEAARDAVLLLKGALPTPTPSSTTDGSR